MRVRVKFGPFRVMPGEGEIPDSQAGQAEARSEFGIGVSM